MTLALPPADLMVAASFVPPGRWGIAVSGGGDSIALLELLRGRSDLTLYVIHLDHETRAGESAKDAAFVRDRAAACGFAHTIAKRSDIERTLKNLPANLSSRYRAARLALFRRVVTEHQLQGVLLAHHADDQAETVLQRLLRGSGPAGLTGMSVHTSIAGLTILRPLLGVRRATLRQFLTDRHVTWREDSSNQSPLQQRNRARILLSAHPALTPILIDLARDCASLMQWLREQSPELGDDFRTETIARLSLLIAREATRTWLQRHAGAETEVSAASAARLLEMATDRATPARQDFPGKLRVRRRGGRIFLDNTNAHPAAPAGP
jgi:tRNA(Ile)-lysidine synthase